MSGIGNTIPKAYWVPGLPHLVSDIDSPVWAPLRKAYQEAADRARATNPDVLVIYSAQWMSVLGHSFQTDPNPSGFHVDENWYEMVDFPFSFPVDVAISQAAAKNAAEAGLATMEVNYEGFPIDTGTLVALRYFNPTNDIPVVIVSSNVYCGQEDSAKLGQAVAKAVADQGKRAVFITTSALSNRFLTEDIDPAKDHIASDSDDTWNQNMLALMTAGKNAEAVAQGPAYAQAANPEMMFKGFYWLMGALNTPATPAELLAYGPVWGTGAAVLEYSLN